MINDKGEPLFGIAIGKDEEGNITRQGLYGKAVVSSSVIISALSKLPEFNGTTQVYDPDTETVVFSINFKDKEPYTGVFSMDEAKRKGLTSHRLWQSIPVDMLAARAKQIACSKAKEMLKFSKEFDIS